MTLFQRGVAAIPWPLRFAIFAVGVCLLALGASGTVSPRGMALGGEHTSGKVDATLPRLPAKGTTLLAFYSPSSVLERGAVDRFEHHPALGGNLRRIPLASMDVAAARQYGVTETPAFFLYSRDGALLLHTSRPEEVEGALDTPVKAAPSPAASEARWCPLRTTPRLAWVEEASGRAHRVYRRWGGGRQPVPDIYKAMSLRPDLMDRVADLTDRAHFSGGYLSRRTKELIATYVSSLNRCGYCLGSHSENLRALGAGRRQAEAVARGDLQAAALTAKDRALLDFVKTVTLTPAGVTDGQVAKLRHLGWRDEQIFEATFDTALFALFNRIADVYGLRYEPDL